MNQSELEVKACTLRQARETWSPNQHKIGFDLERDLPKRQQLRLNRMGSFTTVKIKLCV